MKTKLIMAGVLLALIVLSISAPVNTQDVPMENKLIVEKASIYPFSETVDLLTNEAKQRSWSVPIIHDLQKTLEKSGKKVKPITVIEICKPGYSGQILELDYERIISVMLPCRISVYEKNDGKTYVALIDGVALSADMPGNIAAVMKAASDEIFEIVKKVTD